MLSSDTYIFDDSINHMEQLKPFSNKTLLYCNDQNSSNYAGQIQIDASSLSNSGKWLSYKEAYLQIPFIVSMKADRDIEANINEFSLGLKNGYYQIIESMSVDLNQRNIVQLQNHLNILTNYKVLTSFSQDDLKKYGPILGIGMDSSSSYSYNTGQTSVNGDGLTNNIITANDTSLFAATNFEPNVGAYNRFLNTTATATSTTLQLNKTSGKLSTESRSFYFKTGSGSSCVYNWVIIATIRLKDVCDYFSTAPLMKTANYRFIVNYNSTLTKIKITAATTSPVAPSYMKTESVMMLSGQTNPIMFSGTSAGSANSGLSNLSADTNIEIACNVVKNTLSSGIVTFQTCRLYVPAYELQPQMELQLVQSMPSTKIEYNDYFVYRVTNIGADAPINSLLTNGIVNPKLIIIIPFLVDGGAGSSNIIKLPQYQSPFDSAPATTCPNGSITSLNIQLGGNNVFNLDQQYQFSNFLDEFSKINSLNGSQETGVSSGLISHFDWLNAYRFYVADLSRRLRPEDKQAKSILIRGTNNNHNPIDLLCFVLYERHFTINTVNGEIEDVAY